MKKLGLFVSLALFVPYFVVRVIIAPILFDRNCGGYLERAAKANTVEYAVQNLKVALNYLEIHHLTSGYTSVLYTTPDEDLNYYYSNLQNAEKQLEAVPSTASELEKSNLLLKLHETIMTHEEKSESYVVPEGISIYPYNTFCFIWGILSSICVLFFSAWLLKEVL